MADLIQVLLVEDNTAYSAFVNDALATAEGDFHITTTDSLRHAVESLTSRTFSVVLLDLNLPDSDGLETLNRIQQAAAGMPIVVLSGVLDEDLAVAALQAGAQDYLLKPDIHPAVITRVIRYAIERRAAEARLHERDVHYRSIVESSFDAIITIGADGKITEFNPAAEVMFGRRRDAVIGRELAETIIPERLRDAHRAGLARQTDPAAAIMRRRIELVALRADGEEFPIELTLSKVSPAAGPVFTAFVRDLSERRRAEAEQNRALSRIAEQASLLDQARDAIIVRDLQHRIRYYNRSAERLYGWTSGDVMGQSVRERFFPDPSIFDEAMKTLLTRGDWQGELSVTGRDNARLVVESRWTLTGDASGEPRAVLVIDTDITERKELERRFLRAQRMESIGTLAGGIAHDLNNMLAPVLMSIELLKDCESDAERDSILATIEASTRRGAEMVRQVLTFARGVEGDRTAVDVAGLLKEIEKFANDTFMKNITVSTAVNGNVTVLGDQTQLHQVLINLGVNARDAMPKGGMLTLSAGVETTDKGDPKVDPSAAGGDYVVIRVGDTGTGIAPGIIDRIFEPFFTSKATGKGTGLGLSTSLAIVKSHGGFMRVDSEVGRGSTFTIYLPALAERAQPAIEPEKIAGGRRGAGEMILVVDDEEPVLRMTTLVLESFGYRVLAAISGAEAETLFREHRDEIKVVFTDMTMPGMDGATLIRRVREIDPDARVIAASGLGAAQAARVAGVRRFLSKPYTADTVLKAITDAVRAEA
ncbi:MAG: response regulator [Cyanobacteria bacterium]|nr:response regulator [Cyanobacteriota bacterium]